MRGTAGWDGMGVVEGMSRRSAPPLSVVGLGVTFMAAVALTAGPVAAQSSAGDGGAEGRGPLVMQATPVTGDIVIDGRLDESAWSSALAARDFVQLQPLEGSPATEPTEVRILVDDGAMYVGAHMMDSDPDGIVTRLGRRDQDVQADWFYIYIDGYHDRRTALGFGVSAAGVQRDLRVSDDVQRDDGWDAVWQSEVRRVPDGWVAELRIPLSQLRFNQDGAPMWGANFARIVARKNERSHWAPMSQGTQSFVSRFGDLLGVDGLDPRRRVEILPYTLARVTSEPVAQGDPFNSSQQGSGAVGGDLRVGLGSSLTLSATINPDFGQVEGDPAVLNLTAFETFQQERRPFFLEGADIFGLSFPGWPPAFYSRRIGRSPQAPSPSGSLYLDRPTSTTILGALKLSGKTESGWSIGLLDALTPTEHTRYLTTDSVVGRAVAEPLTHYAAARVAREFRGGRSSVGLLGTTVNRALADDPALAFLREDAYTLALDARHRFAGSRWEARLGLQTSSVHGDTLAIRRVQAAPGHYYQRPDADHLTLDPLRTSLGGYLGGFTVQKIEGTWKTGVYTQATSPGFEVSDLGFNPSLDQVNTNAWLRYEEFTPGSVFRSWGLGSSSMVQSDFGGTLQELTVDAGLNFELLNYWGGNVWVMRHQPAWTTDHLRGGPALRKPGRWMGQFGVNSDRRSAVSGNASVFWEAEDETADRFVNVSTTVRIQPSDRLNVEVGPTVNFGRSDWQFVGAFGAPTDRRYLVGGLDRRTVTLTGRLDYAASRTLSLQVYARPFVGSVEYDAFREVDTPSGASFSDRFRDLAVSPEERDGGDALSLDRDDDGVADFQLGDPSFTTAAVQVNTVLRWEYRPGSTLFAVWSHDRDDFARDDFGLGPSVDRLWAAPARNVFMLKVSYWLGR